MNCIAFLKGGGNGRQRVHGALLTTEGELCRKIRVQKEGKMAKKLFVRILLALMFVVFITLPAISQHQVDLHNNVTLYGQQSCCWCGAASGQMIMNGYPNAVDRQLFTQLSIWNAIQANNSTDPTDVAQNWCTDPIGLRATMISFNPPPGGTWSVHANATRDTVMFDVLFWMNRNNYPVATLINQGGHWVVIVGFTSDVAPLAGSTPVLQDIRIYDPEPHNVGTDITKTAAVWYGTDWNGAVQYAGTWNNRYAAVIEPPVARGTVRVKVVERTGEKIISPEAAVISAKRWIEKLGLGKRHPYTILQKRDLRNLEPMLVREEIRFGMEKEKKVPYYYLIPFGFEYEKAECGLMLARVAVIVNAYSGDFEEIGAFGQAVSYLPQQEAIRIVARAMRLKQEELKNVKATMMFRPSDITHIRVYPFWKVMVGERIMYVDQLGKLYKNILPSVPGD